MKRKIYILIVLSPLILIGFFKTAGLVVANEIEAKIINTTSASYSENPNHVNKNLYNLSDYFTSSLDKGDSAAFLSLGDVWINTGDVVSTVKIVKEGNVAHSEVSPCEATNAKLGGSASLLVVQSSSGADAIKHDCYGKMFGIATVAVSPELRHVLFYVATLMVLGSFISNRYLRYKSGVSPPSTTPTFNLAYI